MFADINGTRIHYERSGAGVPLILLHAGVADSRMWKPQLVAFAQHFDVITPDIRVSGQSDLPATSPVSDAWSKDLKKRGFQFVGSTVMYAHMQAVGMVNDHVVDCFRYRDVRRLGIAPNDPTPHLAQGSVSKKR